MNGLYAVAKRVVDVVGAAAGLVLLAPLFIVCAAAIKLDSPGPVFYRGTRLGRGRVSFRTYKFRSMYADVDDSAHAEYLRQTLTSEPDETATMFKLVDDDRVTRVGRILRRWSIDELPQLINVLRGEMSLVGPRPEVPYALDVYEPWQYRRFEVLPGMTGLWQVSGRALLSPRQMLELDCRYVLDRSFHLDAWILLRTIPAVASRVGSA